MFLFIIVGNLKTVQPLDSPTTRKKMHNQKHCIPNELFLIKWHLAVFSTVCGLQIELTDLNGLLMFVLS